MTVLLVPTPVGTDAPDRTLRTRLDGRDFLLRLVWNGRESRWYMTVSDSGGTVLVSGVKVLANWPLLSTTDDQPYRRWNPDLPPGDLIAVDLTTDGTPPGIDELGEGKRVEMTYFPAGT